jgi:hypothetical protein
MVDFRDRVVSRLKAWLRDYERKLVRLQSGYTLPRDWRAEP